MPTRLTSTAVELSTFIIEADFTDENGAATAPASLAWTLTDAAGNVIGDREDVAVSPLASQVYIALSGDDLAMNEGETTGARILTLEGTYTSAITGGVLPIRDSVHFRVTGLVAVA